MSVMSVRIVSRVSESSPFYGKEKVDAREEQIDGIFLKFKKKLNERFDTIDAKFLIGHGITNLLDVITFFISPALSVSRGVKFFEEGCPWVAREILLKTAQKTICIGAAILCAPYYLNSFISTIHAFLPATIHAFLPAFNFISKISDIFSKYSSIPLVVGVLGFIGCAITLLTETFGIARASLFLRELDEEDVDGTIDRLYEKYASNLETDVSHALLDPEGGDIPLTPEITSLRLALSSSERTVEVLKELHRLHSLSGNGIKSEAKKKFIHDLKVQEYKKIFMHVLGIIACACAIISLALSMFTPFGMISMLFCILAISLGFSKAFFHSVMMEQEGIHCPTLEEIIKGCYYGIVPFPIRKIVDLISALITYLKELEAARREKALKKSDEDMIVGPFSKGYQGFTKEPKIKTA